MKPYHLTWAYGITTIPERVTTLLPYTLQSLKEGGFDKPILFVDGELDIKTDLNVDKHPNWGQLRNWICALQNLAKVKADRYAIFEDDLLACRHLREYLDYTPIDRTYLNLITHEDNRSFTQDIVGWHKSNQKGRGAVGLVFDRKGVELLLRSINHPNVSGTASDAVVSRIMRRAKYVEMVHFPSLLQHVGFQSSLRHRFKTVDSFKGIDYPLLEISVGVP